MSWFRRNQDNIYVQNSRTLSRPVGVIVTIIAVLVLAGAIYALFLGGRWLAQNLDGTNIPKNNSTSVDVKTNTPEEDSADSSDSNSSGSSSSSSTSNSGASSSGSANSSASGGAGSSAGSNSSSASGSSGSTSSSQSSNIANTGPSVGQSSNRSESSIPATGPGELMIVFVVSAVLATGAHSYIARKRS